MNVIKKMASFIAKIFFSLNEQLVMIVLYIKILYFCHVNKHLNNCLNKK